MQSSQRSESLSMLPRPHGLEIGKILVALDFDNQALKVLEAALCIARTFRSEVFLVHAVPAHSNDDTLVKEDACFRESCIQAAIRKLKEAVAARPSLNSLTHHEVAATGSPFNLIQKLVASEKIDLIIVGSHGAMGLERIAIGSFAEGLVRRANCPTLVVGPHAVISGDLFRKVLLATDLGKSCVSATAFAAALAMHSQGELYSLHVISRKNVPILAQSPATEEQFARHSMRTSLPPDLTSQCSVGLLAKHGVAEEIIVDTATEYAAGVIVTGVSEGMLHDEHAPWSTFGAIVREARCPVLAIPNGAYLRTSDSGVSDTLLAHSGH
ncbi:universal stress protein [Terriglobus roseus]|uniref:Nucleotide-binding universal stress protein, UspA family n=1 Tax=Terriglobus roseus TaxID=392734 RepID=A0A1H4L0Q9_9BACT|nr:universal stress protein [Terriglobus roseus]SEB64354.1 Nucleotide-binding universal stress protein, UspA family [Terriglobus roseus]